MVMQKEIQQIGSGTQERSDTFYEVMKSKEIPANFPVSFKYIKWGIL